MPAPSSLLAMAAAVGTTAASFQGFNYAADNMQQADFEAKFKAAKGLPGTNGAFNSARLYTMIQSGTANDPISAIPAGIATKTSLLFGVWGSAGQEPFNNELAALKKTADQYCGQLDGLVAGISVGSEDLYRDSVIGRKNSNGLPGASPETLIKYVNEVRKTVKGTCLEKAPIGHVDTWTAYVNNTADPLIETLDWLGMDTYPYFENQKPNGIENGKALYDAALQKVQGAGGGKPVWITETGWPVVGPTENKAVASTNNAKDYYQKVGCPMFGKSNVWWYTLEDAGASPSFGLMGADGKPTFDLNCKGHETAPTSSKAPETSSKASEKPETSTDAPSTSTKEGGNGDSTTTVDGGNNTPSSEPTTLVSAPSTSGVDGGSGSQPTGGNGGNTGGSGGSGTETSANGGSGAQPTGTGAPINSNGAGQINSFAAAAVAMIMAAVAL